MREVDPALLRELLRYEPETGKLFWLRRDVSLFEDTPNKTAEQQCKWWNGRFADQPAFTARGVHDCRAGRIFGTTHYAHRVIWAIAYGEWPSDEIDHINGNRADNRLSNLRSVSHQVNMQNKARYRSNRSGTPGVSFHPRMKRWQAYITVNGRRRHLGSFGRKSDAVAARVSAQQQSGVFHANHGRNARVQSA